MRGDGSYVLRAAHMLARQRSGVVACFSPHSIYLEGGLMEIMLKDGKIHPCNGFMLIEIQDGDHAGLVVVRDPGTKEYRSGVVVEMSGDQVDADLKVEDWEWNLGDLVYFSEVTEIDGHYFVHWTDVVAYKRF